MSTKCHLTSIVLYADVARDWDIAYSPRVMICLASTSVLIVHLLVADRQTDTRGHWGHSIYSASIITPV